MLVSGSKLANFYIALMISFCISSLGIFHSNDEFNVKTEFSTQVSCNTLFQRFFTKGEQDVATYATNAATRNDCQIQVINSQKKTQTMKHRLTRTNIRAVSASNLTPWRRALRTMRPISRAQKVARFLLKFSTKLNHYEGMFGHVVTESGVRVWRPHVQIVLLIVLLIVISVERSCGVKHKHAVCVHITYLN